MEDNTKRPVDAESLLDTVIENIYSELSARNWSLKLLAEKAGMPYESVKKLLGHKIQRPSFQSVYMIAEALDCSVDKLVGREVFSEEVIQQISEDTSQLYKVLNDLESITRNEL